MSDYTVIMVNASQLVDSPHQPPTRTAAVGPMNQLQNSIKNVGLQYPPLVLPQPNNMFQVVDGHRRIKCMLALGWPKIPVLPTQGVGDKLFAAVSGNVAKMKASEWVTVYLRGGEVPSGPNKSCIIKLEEHMGRGFLERLEAKGGSPQLWNLSNRVLKATAFGEERRSEILEWLMVASTRDVASWITNDNSVDELRKAIQEKRTPKY